eukprot:m51a1_g12595 hypothetical protein (628) ;mRNA; f:842-2999
MEAVKAWLAEAKLEPEDIGGVAETLVEKGNAAALNTLTEAVMDKLEINLDRKRGSDEEHESKQKRRRADTPQYASICERAREFDNELEALRAGKGEFLATSVGDYVRLPVHHHLLESSRGRFRPDDPRDPKFVGVMLRERTKELLAFLRDGKAKGAYLHGPQGAGKSHALYHAVCALRADPSRYRVVYIPDCRSWAVGKKPFRLVLTAIADAFHADPEILSGMPPLYETSYMRKHSDDFQEFIETRLPEYCASRGLQLFAVFDQHNGLTQDQRAQLPFSLPESLPERWIRSALCVVSASANNEYYLKIAADAKWPQLVFNRGFTDAEVTSWCAANGLPSPSDESALDDVLLWTSSVPYDLSLWREQFEPLSAKLAPHSAATAPAWADAIEKSRAKFCIERLCKPADEALARDTYVAMNLGLPLPEAYLLNQQLMFVEGDRVWPTTPLAGATLGRYWEPQATKAIEATVRDVFTSMSYGNDTKGRVLEMYMLRQLESPSVARAGFALPKCKPTGGKKAALQYTIGPYATRIFSGNSVPVAMDWTCPTLLIPKNSNYPCFDLLAWNGDCLLAIQITVAPATHGDITKQMHDMWCRALPAGKKVLFLWVVPKGCALTDSQKVQGPCPKLK